jgi:hypothetical protein
VSPVYPANRKTERQEPTRPGVSLRSRFSAAARAEVTQRRPRIVMPLLPEEDEGAEAEIEAAFRRRLSGLRRMPRTARAHALRAARLERTLALKALREKRAIARHAILTLRRLRKPAPG